MLAEHQREAVERALDLLASRGGVLLADEVGLGKSFVAAEVVRRMGRETDLVVPAALVAQWRETLARFEVEARVVTHDGLTRDPFVPMPRLRLVVVDEAHAFRNPRTQRYAALARRTAGARVLLVTATPVCNSVADLEALLRLLARDDLLAGEGIPSIDLAFETRDRPAIERIVAQLVIRRDRTVLPESLRFGTLDRSVLRHPVLDAPEIGALRFPLVGERAILRRFLRRRLESSESALIESARRQLRFYARALAATATGHALPKRDYRRAFGREEDRDAFQDVLFWELFAPPGDVDASQIREEMARLEALVARARASPCAKRTALVELVAAEREPALIFTGAAATARGLFDALRRMRACGLVTSRDRSRDAVLRAFVSGKLDVVISTDLAAEGLNLQRAGVVIHYDLPWNPVKLDQRNGRAHRIGQPRDAVRAIYFLPENRDTGIVETIARKNRTRRRVLNAAPVPRAPRPFTIRPRLTKTAACLALRERWEAIPEILERRHKAGIEQILAEMSREFLDQKRIDELLALVAFEA